MWQVESIQRFALLISDFWKMKGDISKGKTMAEQTVSHRYVLHEDTTCVQRKKDNMVMLYSFFAAEKGKIAIRQMKRT